MKGEGMIYTTQRQVNVITLRKGKDRKRGDADVLCTRYICYALNINKTREMGEGMYFNGKGRKIGLTRASWT
jgi:hypothetical protein